MADQTPITPNLPRAFFRRLETQPELPLFASRRDGRWTIMTTAETGEAVLRLAGGLIGLGVKPGDRVMIAAENRTEWAIADLAIMAVGGIVVPAYTTNTIDDHAYILGHSGASLAITSGGVLAENVLAAAKDQGLKIIITMEDITAPKGLSVMIWDDLLAGSTPPADLDARLEAIDADDTCCFIYTSGTGGRPKGVMLTHRSIQANIDAAIDLLEEGGCATGQRFLSLLPLSHSYEHTAGLHLPIQTQSEIYYCESADRIANDLAEVGPTLMTAVPRLYEVLYDRITRGVKAKGGLSEKLFHQAVRLGRKKRSTGLNPLEAIFDKLLDRLVRRKVRGRFGGRLQYFISGGAALNPDIGTFFLGLGVNILQGYGQTEASPLISANRPSKIKIETVGPAVRGVEARLSPQGEILVRGDMLMKGYWQDEAATAATIVDGWLHTGDLGSIDADGYITITGRAKDIIVNSGGDNIAPSRVEAMLSIQPEIEQVSVFGDRKPWLAAVIVPSAAVLEAAGDDTKAVEAAIGKAVDRANESLSKIERVRRFILADEPFSTANSQMTATLKPRRHIISDVYGARLNGLYRS
ncbi:MAG: AMP-dependent synthetase/ligase [Candidatus Puniceispirillales bacterium]